MFTGIVQCMGSVRSRSNTDGGVTFAIEPGAPLDLAAGDSISINGACHTVEQPATGVFTVTSVPETLAKTTMGLLESGARVNLETAASMQTALGGHIVQGHVDATGEVVAFGAPDGEGERMLEVVLPEEVYDLTVPRGSIALDGVSLTVARRDSGRIGVAIIPFTLEQTTIGALVPGRRVNVEADIIGKYVAQYMKRIGPVADRAGGSMGP